MVNTSLKHDSYKNNGWSHYSRKLTIIDQQYSHNNKMEQPQYKYRYTEWVIFLISNGLLMYSIQNSFKSLKLYLFHVFQIHEGPDDLGMGGDAGSLKGGNAGPKVACCVIALADPTHDHLHSFNSDDQEGVAKHEGHTGLHIHEVKPWSDSGE